MKSRAIAVALVLAACNNVGPVTRAGNRGPASYGLGRAATGAEIGAVDIDVDDRGRGLPAGQGNASQGAVIFAAKCAMCHGVNGEGQGTFPKLIGREPNDSFNFGNDFKRVKTIGNYWPYATTLYDYVHRAMPFTAPGSLQPAEVYALVAFLLAKNGIISESDVVDARSLPAIVMPARSHFVRDDRKGGKAFR